MTTPETVPQSEVVDVMRSQRVATLTTRTSAGKLVAHPMTVQEVTDDADVWLFLDGRSDHAEALRGDPAVNLAFSGSGSWLSVSGTAEFVDDRAKAEELWDGSVDAYFDGVHDPRAALLRIESDSAQFWGVPGGAPAVLAAVVKAKATGRKPHGQSGTTEL